MRPTLVAALLSLVVAGCGDVCTRIGGATDVTNEKAKNCGTSTSNPYDVAACQRGLSKCSPDDVKELESYAQCLESLPMCQEGQEMSFGLARLGCVQPLTRVSYACANAMK